MHSAPTTKLPENDSHQQQSSSNKQNAQKPPTTTGGGLPLWMWLLFTILFLTAIALGYRLGFKANDTKTSGVHRSLKLETELRNSTMSCERTRAALYRQKRSGNNYSNAEEKKTIEDLEDRADELREMNDDLFQKHRSLAQQQVACDEEVERVRRQIEDAAKPEVDRLTALVQKEEERSKIVQNQNVGAQRVLLLQVLNERRARNFQLRRELGMSVPEDRQSYENNLMTKYKIAEKADGFPDDVQSISVRSVARRRNASTLLDPKKNGGIENLTIDDAILAITSNWEPFKYDPAVHNKDLFFTPRIGPSSSTIALTASEFSSPSSASNNNKNNDNNDDDDSSPNEKREKTLEKFRPVHFGRTGNPPPVKGILEKTQLATLSIAQMLRIIVRISFCALRKNNPNFTVPFQFNRPADPLDPIVQSASLVIDTPLIRFCHGCPHTIQTKEFKLACDGEAYLVGKDDGNENGDSSSLQSNQEHVTSVYGSFDFWRTRSRVRFTPKVIAAADDQMRKRGINGNTTLAIDFKRSSYFEKACKQWEASKSLPLKHYMWLFSRSSSNSKNKNSESESETSSSNSTTAASSGLVEVIPSLNETFRQCFPKMDDLQKGVVNIALQRDYIDTVFIAADASDEEFLEFALRNVDFGPLKIVTSYPKSALTDTVEMEIMSQCDSILVNRFREHSQHVTELYLLQNEFKADGVFFF